MSAKTSDDPFEQLSDATDELKHFVRKKLPDNLRNDGHQLLVKFLKASIAIDEWVTQTCTKTSSRLKDKNDLIKRLGSAISTEHRLN